MKANQELDNSDLRIDLAPQFRAVSGSPVFSRHNWPVGNYRYVVTVDGQKNWTVAQNLVNPIDLPSRGRVFVKNLSGDRVRLTYNEQSFFGLASNDQGFVSDKDGNAVYLNPEDRLTLNGRTVRVQDVAKWSLAKDGSCYWKLVVGGASSSEDP